MRKRIAYIIFTIFLLYGLNYTIFERVFFFNEVLSLLGILIFLYKGLTPKLTFKVPRVRLYHLVLCFLLLNLFHATISIATSTNFYYYFRSSVIFYSSFGFFLGFYLFQYFEGFIKMIKSYFLSYIVVFFIYPVEILLDRFSAAVFLPFLFKSTKILSIISLLVLTFIYAQRYASMTVSLIGIILIGIIMIPSYRAFKMLFFSGFTFALIIFLSFIPYYKLYKTNEYSLFGDIWNVRKDNVYLQIDPNSTWRAVFWYRVTTENFPENLLGIGFGTPILPYEEGKSTTASGHTDEYDAHVIGCHNTYITLSVRLGVCYLVLLLCFYGTIMKEYYNYNFYYRKRPFLMLCFWSFFIISIIGLFNLVLESPIYATIYWIVMGFVAQIMARRQAEFSKISIQNQNDKITN